MNRRRQVWGTMSTGAGRMEGAERVRVGKFKGGREGDGRAGLLAETAHGDTQQQASFLFPKRGKPLHSCHSRLFPRGATHGKWTQGS